MIDENKEQLRNLFRNYNVLDVQPAVTARAPDDLTTLQVCVCMCIQCICCIKNTLYTERTPLLSLSDGHYHLGSFTLPCCHVVYPDELVLPHSVSSCEQIMACVSF